MQITIEPYAWFGTNDHHYGEKHIQLIAYKARFIDGSIQLVDHDEVRWVKRHELVEYTFAPADVKFVEILAAEAGCSIGHALSVEDIKIYDFFQRKR
ncbi:hypothetical protein J2TS6_45240 [Paenibacillus albilobatus]|uniref:NUDIX hydrolase n=2 Tax=Paenibacillus TaxID=44249 RepID=A0A919XL31_9BACL|nr:hypothetical protein J2TS6_45240 [Paenibacillus albilobatus]